MYLCIGVHIICVLKLCTTNRWYISQSILQLNNVVHMRNNSDWRYKFTMEVNIMFTAIITASEGILYLTETSV